MAGQLAELSRPRIDGACPTLHRETALHPHLQLAAGSPAVSCHRGPLCRSLLLGRRNHSTMNPSSLLTRWSVLSAAGLMILLLDSATSGSLTLNMYNNTALHGNPTATSLVHTFPFALPTVTPLSAEVRLWRAGSGHPLTGNVARLLRPHSPPFTPLPVPPPPTATLCSCSHFLLHAWYRCWGS